MKPLIKFSCIIVIILFNTSFTILKEYDIAEFYSAEETRRGSKVLTKKGNLEDADYILSTTSINPGKYKLNVTRKAQDLYEIDGKDIFIETRYCFEYVTQEEAILIVESSYGFTKGKIIF